MPLYVDSIRQDAYGTVDSASSAVVGFDTSKGFTACAAGNTVVLIVTCGLNPATPGGFTSDFVATAIGSTPSLSQTEWFRLSGTAGGETTWTVSEASATATAWTWRAVELVGLAAAPLAQWGSDAVEAATGASIDASVTGGETGSAQRLDVVQLGVSVYWGPPTAAQIAVGAWSKNTGALGGQYKLGDAFTQVSAGPNLLTAYWQQFSDNLITDIRDSLQAKTTIPAGTTAFDQHYGGWVTYAALNSAVLDPIIMGTGFEFGTHHGCTGGPTAAPGPAQIVDAVGGTHGTGYAVVTTAPKNGTYHLRIVAAATAPFWRWTTNTIGAGVTQTVFGGYVKCVSATSNPAVLAEFTGAVGTNIQIVYNVTTTKIGVRRGAGTPSYQSGTTALGAYAWVDLLGVWNSATQPVTWRCEQGGVVVDQTPPADLAGQTSTTWATAVLGSATSQTMTADYDDICLASQALDYPLGRHKVVLLIPDTAVAAGLAGSAGANWSAITNNAVGSNLTTVGAAAVPALLDEVPPNFSATADGIAAVTVGGTDTVTINMTTYTAAATERIDAVRFYLAGWAATTATASLPVDWRASSSQTNLIASTVHGTFINTTTGTAIVPGWYCKNIGGMTQADLDVLRFILGPTTDATPDIGLLGLYVEVAVFIDFVPAPTRSLPSDPRRSRLRQLLAA